MWLKYLLILMLCFLWNSPTANALWELRADLRTAMDTETIDQAVASNWEPLEGSEAFTVPDIHTQVDGIPVSVTGITGRVYYKIGAPVRTDSSLIWDSESEEMRVELTINRVHAFKIERRTFNGGFIDIRIEGSCDSTLLSIPEASGTRVTSQVVATMKGGNLQLQNKNAIVEWPQDAWQVDRLSCSGLEGFGEQVKQYTLELLAVPTAEVQAGLQSAIQKRLDSWAESAVNIAMTPQLVFPDRKDVVLTTNPGNLGELNNGQILVDGKARLQLPSVAPGENHIIEQKFLDPDSNVSGASETQLPVSAVRSLLMAGYFSRAFDTEFDSHQFKAFNDLMQDRQAQSYVFPDLLRFSKKTKFEFAATTMAAPTMNNIRNADQAGVLLADATIPLLVLMQAPRKELFKYVPYVQWRGNIRGTAMMRIVNGQLAVQMRDAVVDISSGWNQDYVKKYKPNTKIRDEIFADALSDAVRKEVHMIDLPVWRWDDESYMRPVEMAVDGERLRVYWEHQDTPARPSDNIISERREEVPGRSIAQAQSNEAQASKASSKNAKIPTPTPLTDREKERIFDGVRSDIAGSAVNAPANQQAGNQQSARSNNSWLWNDR